MTTGTEGVVPPVTTGTEGVVPPVTTGTEGVVPPVTTGTEGVVPPGRSRATRPKRLYPFAPVRPFTIAPTIDTMIAAKKADPNPAK